MLDDLESQGPDAAIDADLCIVGAGAAGLTIANELRGSGLRVVIVESGGATVEDRAQALNEGDCVGWPLSLTEARFRALGGSTTRWTGRCIKLDALDFEPRPWLTRSGWPFPRTALDPYYERALDYCGFSEPWRTDAEAFTEDLGFPAPAFDPALVQPCVWRYAPQAHRVPVDFGARQRAALQRDENVRVLLHATATAFETSDDGAQVTAITVRAPSGETARVAARAFALCCGGVENARLLLLGARERPGGFGDGNDQLGRFFMQHTRGRFATLDAATADARRLQDIFNLFTTRRGVQYETGFVLSPEAQRRDELLNASAIFVYDADPASSWDSAKELFGRMIRRRIDDGLPRLAGRVLADPGSVAGNIWRRMQGRHAILATRSLDLLIDLEQDPDPDSRITLSETTDALGVPRPKVDWRLSELERRTAAQFAEHLVDEFARLGLGEVIPDAWLSITGGMEDAPLVETYHHLGATRMSERPEDGVVDPDSKVHGMANLFVTGGSVFPTGGHGNPTLTIVALAARLADHLKAELTQ